MNTNHTSRITASSVTELAPNEIFVFGSNLAGAHGAGAARQALKWGAVYGCGSGIQGQTYGIATKDRQIKTLSLMDIFKEVERFTEYAIANPSKVFLVTRVGCGLAGYTDSQIAPLFMRASKLSNVHLPIEFWNLLNQYFNSPPRLSSAGLYRR